MDLKCSYSGCPKEVFWQCTCLEKFTFCDAHARDHSKVKKCFEENIRNKYIDSLAKQYKNALCLIESDYIKLAQEMIAEVNGCFIDNLCYLNRKKKEVNDLILNEQIDQAETIVNWSNTLNIMQRERKSYYLSLRKLLCIDNSFIKIVTDTEKLEDDLKKIRKDFEESLNKINGLEKELKNSQKISEEFELKYEHEKNKLNQEKKYFEEQIVMLRKGIEELDKKSSPEVKEDAKDEDMPSNMRDTSDLAIKIDKHIKTLCYGDMTNSVDALVAIKDIVLNKLEEHKELLKKKANNLVDALTKVIIKTFDKPAADIPFRFAKYMLTVVNKVCCTKIIMSELNEITLFALIEQILTCSLIDNLEQAGEKAEGELILKNINETMLRILEHCHPTRTFIILIRLLTKYKSGASLQKMPGLIIRCLLKLTKIMSELIHQIELDKLLLVMHEYLSGYGIDDIDGNRAIKFILTELVNLQGPTIWISYEEIRKHSVPDVHMEKWITEILNSSIHGQNALISPRSKPIDIISDIFSIIKHDYTKGFTQLMEHFGANLTVDYTSYISTLPIELQQKVREDLEASKVSNQMMTKIKANSEF
ncbi:hypothetical protein SteCoe_17878 [Stentor coeruleus]|uniref:Uncharacterized protein n=1 Tax=Stentor coeruleus TaxID=5963 RepID=A0A1R2BXU5_9CILI|nr:hypothetical protein SteCoe_17878 [Stentor coeruleus]